MPAPAGDSDEDDKMESKMAKAMEAIKKAKGSDGDEDLALATVGEEANP